MESSFKELVAQHQQEMYKSFGWKRKRSGYEILREITCLYISESDKARLRVHKELVEAAASENLKEW